MISDAVNSGLAGMREASNRLASAADAISRPPETSAAETSRPVPAADRETGLSPRPPDTELARELLELRRSATHHEASQRVTEAGLSLLGSLVDLRA